MRDMSYYRRAYQAETGESLSPSDHIHHVDGNHHNNNPRNWCKIPQPVHKEIDRGILGNMPRPSDPDSKEEGFLTKGLIKQLIRLLEAGRKEGREDREFTTV
tara:strand:- start:39 stop:344 length:306 start_codon:yes stop_codon:yes gene_type:complete